MVRDTRELVSSLAESFFPLTNYKSVEILEPNSNKCGIEVGKINFLLVVRTQWLTFPQSNDRIQVNDCYLMSLILIRIMMKRVRRAVYELAFAV